MNAAAERDRRAVVVGRVERAVAASACLVALMGSGGCGAAPHAATASSASAPLASASAGDLPPAEPVADGAADRGETGSTARIVLGARRQRAIEVFNRFQQAIARRDLATIGAMLDASVYTSLDSGETLPREAAVAELETLLARVDLNQLAQIVASFRPVARSSAEYRRVGRSTRLAVTADDWFVEPSNRVLNRGMGGAGPPVVTVMVRFVGDESVIAGYNRSMMVR